MRELNEEQITDFFHSFNDVLAMQQNGLQIRASTSVVANGFYFS